MWIYVVLGVLGTLALLTLCIALVAVETELLAQRPTPRDRRR